MFDGLIKYLPQRWQIWGAALAVTIGCLVTYLTLSRPTSPANEAWRDIAESNDPCVFETFARTYANDPIYTRLARQKAGTLGACPSTAVTRAPESMPTRPNGEPSNNSAAYDLGALNSDVRAVVESARQNEGRANENASRARQAAALAENAARRARAGEQGFRVTTQSTLGAWQESGFIDGVFHYVVYYGRSQDRERFAGQYIGGASPGVGVLSFAPSATTDCLRYEGQLVRSALTGFGVCHRRDGVQYAGGYNDQRPAGPGTLRYPDGSRYEGDVAGGRHGIGVLWDARGGVSGQGSWTNDRLTANSAP